MSERLLIDYIFHQENEEIDNKFYDPSRIDINPEEGIFNLREQFQIYKISHAGHQIPDKIADGVGHYQSCPYFVVEVTKSDIDYAILQLTRTIFHIYRNGEKVEKVAIILDEKRWNKRLANKLHKIQEDLLFKKGEVNSEIITITFDANTYEFPIYIYLEDFKKYKLE